jgi:deazaflavin-dependent oxidoreductase (nitroreductase family)
LSGEFLAFAVLRSFVMRRLMNKLLNPFMKELLRSPFHPLVSRSYLLITVTGRKTGKLYTTPVQYGQQDGKLFIVTNGTYKWWKNLEDGAEVKLRLRGKDYLGYARLTANELSIAEYFHVIYPSASAEQIKHLLPTCVGIQIELEPEQTFA